MELDALGFAGKIIPYFIVSAAIAAIVAGLRRGFHTLEESKILSSVVPLILGALAGFYVHSLAPKIPRLLCGFCTVFSRVASPRPYIMLSAAL